MIVRLGEEVGSVAGVGGRTWWHASFAEGALATRDSVVVGQLLFGLGTWSEVSVLYMGNAGRSSY